MKQVRQAHRREGWRALTLEEQQWSMLDQSLHPELYNWMQQDEAEDAIRRQR